MQPLSRSPFSFHFNNLVYLGVWVVDTENPTLLCIYCVYRLLVNLCEVCGVLGLIQNLVLVFGDLQKMSWNLCITSLLVGISLKTFHLYHRHNVLDRIRIKLHNDAELRRKSGDLFINESAMRELKIMRILFYATMIMFIPTWIITRYFVHRELPIPFFVPEPFDLTDEAQFNFIFIFLSFCAIFGLTATVETQLAMFGILIQISREYTGLLNDIPKLNQFYEASDFLHGVTKKGEDAARPEVNPWLRKMRTKMLVKKFSSRLQELIEYTETFELCYKEAFFEEVIVTSVIIITLAVQSLLGKLDLSGDFFYQIGYLYIVVFDMFSICMYASRLQTQCFQVGVAAYSTRWYRMAADVQRDLSMIIMRSQHPPKITAGKLMQLNLEVFLHRMSNIYSCLALLRQFEFKVIQDSQREPAVAVLPD